MKIFLFLPSIFIECFVGLLLIVEISHEDMASENGQLARAVLVALQQLRSIALAHRTDGAKSVVPEESVSVRSRALAHAVDLAQRYADADEEVERLFGDGRRAAVEVSAFVEAQLSVNLLQHEQFGEREFELTGA